MTAVPVVESSMRVEPLPLGGHLEEWIADGRLHRTDGPAYVVRNAAGVVVSEQWWVEDRAHRTDGPAWVERNAAGAVVLERWWVKGKLSTPGKVLEMFLADRGVAGLSPEALEFLGRNHPYEQWSFITDNEVALAKALFPDIEVDTFTA